jgi:hypothetical protein
MRGHSFLEYQLPNAIDLRPRRGSGIAPAGKWADRGLVSGIDWIRCVSIRLVRRPLFFHPTTRNAPLWPTLASQVGGRSDGPRAAPRAPFAGYEFGSG